jgi:uncharacterized protein with HEPN domain
MKGPDRSREYLQHALVAIDRITLFTSQSTEESFLANLLVQDAVIRNFEVIGEVAARILREYPALAEEHPELPLRRAYGMRNVLARGYDHVELEQVWSALTRDLPEMRRLIVEILESS